jgi:4-diphosphocytidyl-2-C-methyl-D-erythritol kinase
MPVEAAPPRPLTALRDLPAPAKLNVFLHITGRRPDGYHLLQSVFMLVDWQDTLHIELRASGGLSREDLGEPLPPEDLCLRAARALQEATGTRLGAHIAIDKRLPAQAGMGGGSSDAATCLLALNRLWGLGLSRGQLERIALRLGADLPFFLRGRNAWVEGIGEQITPIELPPARFVVVKPPQGLETARIFGDAALRRDTEPAIISGFAAALGAGSGGWLGFGRNDLQPVAERLCPGVALALAWLSSLGLKPRMTGSGSAVFAHLPEGHPAPVAPPEWDGQGWRVQVCSNMAAHPLAGWAVSDD